MLGPLTFHLPQASTMAAKTDMLYDFLYWASVVMFVPTIVGMLYFAYKYRADRKNPEKVPHIHGNPLFEWTVSTVLGVVFVVIFVWGLIGFNEIHSPPENSYEINVIGLQWMWTTQYANGKTETNTLHVPKGKPVKLIMTSKDVIHDFFVPAFRLKQDVVPGMYTSLWFQATQVGEFDIFCAQYCGTAHSDMIGKVVVMEPADFEMWLAGMDPSKVNVADLGKQLFMKRNCVACHSVDSTLAKAGPSMKGLFGKMVTLTTGTTKADENYLRDSIMNPGHEVVKGFSPIMPTYKGLLNDEDVNALVAYIKSLKE